MKNIKINSIIATLALVLPLVTGNAALAQTVEPLKAGTMAAKVSELGGIRNLADREINRRLEALNDRLNRLQSIKKLSESDRAAITTEIQSQIDAMNAIKAKIEADTDKETLRADVKSITDSYRIFALIMPRTAITAAADRISNIVDSFNALAVKLQSRINNAQSAGADMGSSIAALADFNAKIADANTMAQAALAEVAGLTPDQGNKDLMKSNIAALKDARSKIKSAEADIKAARKDVETIRVALKATAKVNEPTPAPATNN